MQHANLNKNKWADTPLCEQLANIGSEVSRAINWKKKNNTPYSRMAFERALELLDITMDSIKISSKLKEIARLRECIVDYYYGENLFKSTEESLTKYFMAFAYAARKNS